MSHSQQVHTCTHKTLVCYRVHKSLLTQPVCICRAQNYGLLQVIFDPILVNDRLNPIYFTDIEYLPVKNVNNFKIHLCFIACITLA